MDKFWENYITTRPVDSKGAFEEFKQMNQEPRSMIPGPRNMQLAKANIPRHLWTNMNTPDLEQSEVLRPGETLEDWKPNPFLKPHADGGRIGYEYAGIVKQGPNTGKHKYLDFYPKGTKGGTTEWFASKPDMNKALEKRKEVSGRGLTDKEMTTKYKKFLKEEGFKTWKEADKKAKNRMISALRYSKGLDYEIKGRPDIKQKTIDLLESKKPINSRTGLPYTIEEYKALSDGQKHTLLRRLKGKVKTSAWAKRQGWYPEKKANKLMTYLKHAAKKQEKLPFKERNFINVWEGEKFVGVKDVRKNTLWTHIDYDLTGKKGADVITNHPGHKNIQYFLEQAGKFKLESPDELLGSYFTKYKRVPTYSEMYRFFTIDPQTAGAKSGKAYTFNPLQQHHQELMAKEPAKSIQLTLSKQNTEASRILNQFEKGNYSLTEANKRLNEIGVRIKGSQGWMGPAKGEITTAKSIEAAKKETVQMFEAAHAKNPKIVQQMTEALKINLKALCPKKASGGRIGYNTGLAVTGTLECGIAQFNKNMKTGNANSALMRRILASGGNILKAGIQQVNPAELLKLRNLVGPQALGLFAAWEAGEITTDHLRKGTPWNEAFAKNWLTKSFMPFSEEFAKQKNLLQSGMLDTDAQRIYALDMMKAEKAWKEMDRIEGMERDQLVDVGGYGMIDGSQMVTDESIADAKENVTRIIEDLDSRGLLENTGMEMENIRAMDEKAATEMAKDDWKPIRHMFSDAFLETWGIGKGFEDPFEPKVTRGERIARAGKNAIVGQEVDYSRPTYKTSNLTEQDVLNMYKNEGWISPMDYKSGMKLPPGELTWWRMQDPGRGIWGTQYNADGGRAGYMGGGIASILKPSEIPPERGGLRSIMINGKKY